MSPEPLTDMSSPRRVLRDLATATAFLTRIPIVLEEPPHLMRTAWCFPVVGAGIGLFAGLVLVLAAWLGLPPLACSLCALAAAAAATGALHEDGLADLADGLGCPDPERRLAAMRDSRIGTWGVLTLVLMIALKSAAIAAILEGAGVLAALLAFASALAAGRAAMVAAASVMEPASDDGLAHAAGHPERGTAAFGLACAGGLLVVMLPAAAAAVVLVAALAGAAVAAGVASRTLGGYTGDVLGGMEQAAETLALLALAAWFGADPGLGPT